MANFILVPGAWHGGWWYQPVVDALERAGHRAHAVTLLGLGPADNGGVHPTGDRAINLDDHIDQLEAEMEHVAGTERVVLVGHSYAGMVITAVADRQPERVEALVYLDADVPDDAESCWSLAPPQIRDSLIEGASGDGITMAPLPFFDERARPHPLATVVQAVRLTGAWRQIPVKVFVAALDTPGGLQAPASMDKVRNDPDWRYEEWHTSHNVLRDGPTEVVNVLLSVVVHTDRSSQPM